MLAKFDVSSPVFYSILQMVKDRLSKPDVLSRGWLLDGYPRSLSQAEAIEKLNIRPQLFILLDVCYRKNLLEIVPGRSHFPVFPLALECFFSQLLMSQCHRFLMRFLWRGSWEGGWIRKLAKSTT